MQGFFPKLAALESVLAPLHHTLTWEKTVVISGLEFPTILPVSPQAVRESLSSVLFLR